MIRALKILIVGLMLGAPMASAQSGDCPANTICGSVTDFVVKPLPLAIPPFVAETPGAEQLAQDMSRVVANNLVGSGLFREVPVEAHIERVSNFDAPVQFASWSPINVDGLVTGAVSKTSDGRVVVKFRLWDVVNQRQLGEGQQFVGSESSARRMAHKISDAVYARLTGESGYFDSRVVFVSETGPKNARRKQLAVMDQDGANLKYLTQDTDIVLAPRFSPNNNQVIFTSYETGQPRVYLMDVNSLQRRALGDLQGVTFAPRFSPDGSRVVLSQSDGANTDIFSLDIASGQRTRLTNSPAIETAPAFSPDGSQIVFESDRGGSQQLYVMPANGGEPRRISFGEGRYATPVWSPRGDLIAFTKLLAGRFHIGVMRTDGQQERLLTSAFIDEAPTWAPNGRVLMFFRETSGEGGAPALYSIDITGRNERRIPTPSFASDPHWSSLLQ